MEINGQRLVTSAIRRGEIPSTMPTMTTRSSTPPPDEGVSADALADFLGAIGVIETELVPVELGSSMEVSFERDPDFRFGAIIGGNLSIWLDGDPHPISLKAGDSFLLSGTRAGRSFTSAIGSEVPTRTACSEFVSPTITERVGVEPKAIVLGGRFMLDPKAGAWLREALPPLIHVTAEAVQANQLSAVIHLLQSESERGALGKHVITARLADVFLVQTIRAYFDENPGATHWLAALTDQHIGRAMRCFHADFANHWTVASLAQAAGMSRSSFAKRFRDHVGLSPLDYVNRWRMYRVRRDLIETSLPFSTIAYRNGYSSRTYCSQAFKEEFGCSPSQFRVQRKSRSR